MQVAVLVDGTVLQVLGAEGRLGSLAGLEVLHDDGIAAVKRNKLDGVLVEHGVGNGADLDDELVALALDDRHVLFSRGVGGVGVEGLKALDCLVR